MHVNFMACTDNNLPVTSQDDRLVEVWHLTHRLGVDTGEMHVLPDPGAQSLCKGRLHPIYKEMCMQGGEREGTGIQVMRKLHYACSAATFACI